LESYKTFFQTRVVVEYKTTQQRFAIHLRDVSEARSVTAIIKTITKSTLLVDYT